jgi:Tfp pilus assembly protein FimT
VTNGGNPSLLAIAVVFLAIGVPSLMKWIRTL